MNEIISKFNLYEYFRILLPGFYSVYIIYEWLKSSSSILLTSNNDLIIALLIIVFSLIIGTLIYALDLCRFFKHFVFNLPTNLMEQGDQIKFPKSKSRVNEHKYYTWYNSAPQSIRSKTELQSGLYHLSMNFALVAIFGVVSCFLRNDFCSELNSSFLKMNILLFTISVLSAFVLVKRRLNFLWQSNYWSFKEAQNIKHKSTDKGQSE